MLLFLLIVKDNFLLIYRAKMLARNRNLLEKVSKKVSGFIRTKFLQLRA